MNDALKEDFLEDVRQIQNVFLVSILQLLPLTIHYADLPQNKSMC